MKTLANFLKAGLGLLSILILLSACDREAEVNLAEDEELRDDVYQQILNDEELFTEFLNEVRESERPMTWMSEHKPMMRNMFTRNQVRRTMRNDPDVIDSVMQGMMYVMEEDTTMFQRNPRMHRRMMQHIMMMMKRDTAMYGQMERMMEEHRNERME
jgi:hypothetical protein